MPLDQCEGFLPASFNGKIIAVEYFLKCFVKHKAISDFGEGKFCLFPITLNHAFAVLPSKEKINFEFPVAQATVYDPSVLTKPPTQEEYAAQALLEEQRIAAEM